jgi:predicted RNase H-like nuclease (RuvC/YqgF family)
MSSIQSKSSSMPDNLPEDFFDSDKKSKKEQQDEISKALEEWEKEVADRDAETERQLEEELEMLQREKNIDELDQQLEQWKRFAELEKKAQELQTKKDASDNGLDGGSPNSASHANRSTLVEEADMSDDDENFEDKLFDWRSKGL